MTRQPEENQTFVVVACFDGQKEKLPRPDPDDQGRL
jgi:hypothetical protein